MQKSKMKFIILLSVLVVVTQQQYNQQFLVPRSWLPFSYHQQSSHYDADPQQHEIYDYSPYNRLEPVFIYNDVIKFICSAHQLSAN